MTEEIERFRELSKFDILQEIKCEREMRLRGYKVAIEARVRGKIFKFAPTV